MEVITMRHTALISLPPDSFLFQQTAPNWGLGTPSGHVGGCMQVA